MAGLFFFFFCTRHQQKPEKMLMTYLYLAMSPMNNMTNQFAHTCRNNKRE